MATASLTSITLPLWRVWTRVPQLRGSQSLLVAAATRQDAISIVQGTAHVTRCTRAREVRS